MTDKDTLEAKFMGPLPVSSETQKSVDDPSRFITSYTNEVEYCNKLHTWVDILQMNAVRDAKATFGLQSIGILIYSFSDKTAKDMLRKQETNGNLIWKGEDNEEDRKRLLAKIIETMAKDSATERFYRDLDLSGLIYGCKCNRNETAEVFAKRFDRAVAK